MPLLTFACTFSALGLFAERLPVRVYTAADGLADNSVHHILRDSRGFLWFSTSDGISRFDGSEFRTWTTDNGLPLHSVNRALETRRGEIVIATSAGVCRFIPGGSRFICHSPEEVSPGARVVGSILEADDGSFWVGTAAGLYRMHEQGGQTRFERIPLPAASQPVAFAEAVHVLGRDPSGAPLFGVEDMLLSRGSDGQPLRLLDGFFVYAFTIDRDRLWLASQPRIALFQLTPRPHLLQTFAQPSNSLPRDILRQSNGTLWLATAAGLTRMDPGVPADRWTTYAAASGVGPNHVESLAEDLDGNLWAATDGNGAVKISSSGWTSFGAEDGLAATPVSSIFESRNGDLLVVTRSDSHLFVNRFDGRRFHAVRVNLPPGSTSTNWRGMYQPLLEGDPGEWWAASEHGVFRFTGIHRLEDLASATPSQHFALGNGLPIDQVILFHRENSGQIWVVTQFNLKNPLLRFQRSTGTLEPWQGTAGMTLNRPNAIKEDHAGQLWIGLYRGGRLLRRRGSQGARAMVDQFGEKDGVPIGRIHALHIDAAGRLWIATGDGGLARVDHPEAPHPVFRRYTRREGLSSETLYSLTEDRLGRIYIGNGHGVDRLDPANGQVKQYTSNDGLLSGEAHLAFKDRHGAIWIGTSQGVSRLVPSTDTAAPVPTVRLIAVRAGNQVLPIDPAGSSALTLPEFSPGTNTLQIEYASPHFSADPVRYRFRLQGSGGDWSAPTAQRSVLYAGLSPGKYQFLVQPVAADGRELNQPATVAFSIASPWWMRWWFLTLAAATALALVYQAYRYRVQRLLELEHVRLRIASDLHDDIGSGLSHIAILSELAQRQDDSQGEALPKIADLSRELTESMSDIVWSVNPRNDRAGALTQRMRRFAGSMLEAAGIELHLSSGGPLPDRRLDTDTRRQVYLIFKECIHNAARHSGATAVTVTLQVQGSHLVLEVSDNGRGIPQGAAEAGGNGLATMQARAESIGGELHFQNSGGARISLRVPLRPPLHG